MNIGLTIKYKRIELNITQAELANSSKISQTYLSCIENNIARPSLIVLSNIANSLNISLTYLLFESSTLDNDLYHKEVTAIFKKISDYMYNESCKLKL